MFYRYALWDWGTLPRNESRREVAFLNTDMNPGSSSAFARADATLKENGANLPFYLRSGSHDAIKGEENNYDTYNEGSEVPRYVYIAIDSDGDASPQNGEKRYEDVIYYSNPNEGNHGFLGFFAIKNKGDANPNGHTVGYFVGYWAIGNEGDASPYATNGIGGGMSPQVAMLNGGEFSSGAGNVNGGPMIAIGNGGGVKPYSEAGPVGASGFLISAFNNGDVRPNGATSAYGSGFVLSVADNGDVAPRSNNGANSFFGVYAVGNNGDVSPEAHGENGSVASYGGVVGIGNNGDVSPKSYRPSTGSTGIYTLGVFNNGDVNPYSSHGRTSSGVFGVGNNGDVSPTSAEESGRYFGVWGVANNGNVEDHGGQQNGVSSPVTVGLFNTGTTSRDQQYATRSEVTQTVNYPWVNRPNLVVIAANDLADGYWPMLDPYQEQAASVVNNSVTVPVGVQVRGLMFGLNRDGYMQYDLGNANQSGDANTGVDTNLFWNKIMEYVYGEDFTPRDTNSQAGGGFFSGEDVELQSPEDVGNPLAVLADVAALELYAFESADGAIVYTRESIPDLEEAVGEVDERSQGIDQKTIEGLQDLLVVDPAYQASIDDFIATQEALVQATDAVIERETGYFEEYVARNLAYPSQFVDKKMEDYQVQNLLMPVDEVMNEYNQANEGSPFKMVAEAYFEYAQV